MLGRCYAARISSRVIDNILWWMYAPFDVPRLLGRPLEVSLTKDSGLAGLIFVLHQHLGLTVAKDDPRLHAVYDWLVSEFDNGRQTSVEWEELEPVVARVFGSSAGAGSELAQSA